MHREISTANRWPFDTGNDVLYWYLNDDSLGTLFRSIYVGANLAKIHVGYMEPIMDNVNTKRFISDWRTGCISGSLFSCGLHVDLLWT